MPPPPVFVHLRLHSEYSVVDGIVRIDEAVEKAAADAMPALALVLGLSMEGFWLALASLLIGTPALCAFGAIGAAVTVGLKRGGLVSPVLVLPLSLPVLIFGTGAFDLARMGGVTQALLLLAALSLLSVALAPFAAALAIRISGE